MWSAFFVIGARLGNPGLGARARVEREAKVERKIETGRGPERVGRVYRDIPKELLSLIEPVVEDHGCEVVDVESRVGSARTGLLRVTVDRREGDGRVPVERCAEISREIGTQLDVHDAIPGAYHLEVSSPGLDRVLGREKDFAAACGQQVKLKTRRPVDGRRQFKGRLVSFDGSALRIHVDGEELELAFTDVEKANSVYEFGPADFGKGKKRAGEGRAKTGARRR